MDDGEAKRRAGGRKCWKYTNTPQIRIQIHKIHTERQEIHKYKNTDTHKYKYHCWESQLEEEEEEMRFFWKILLTKTALTSVPEKFQKLPGCQNDCISQGKISPSNVECVKNLFRGLKVLRSIKKLGEDRIFWHHRGLTNFQIQFKFLFFNILTFPLPHHLPNYLVELGRRKKKQVFRSFLGNSRRLYYFRLEEEEEEMRFFIKSPLGKTAVTLEPKIKKRFRMWHMKAIS